MLIRDRIVELRRVPASELRPSSNNWRTHPEAQQNALRGLLAEIGFAGAELARELPDGTLELIDGHLRAELAGDSPVPVLVLDLNEDEAAKLLATFDTVGAMAEADSAKLDALLREVDTGSEAVAAMLAKLVTIDDAQLAEGWGQGKDNATAEPNNCVLFLGLYVPDLAEFERLLALVALPEERPIDTIKRGLNGLHTEGPERKRPAKKRTPGVQGKGSPARPVRPG